MYLADSLINCPEIKCRLVPVRRWLYNSYYSIPTRPNPAGEPIQPVFRCFEGVFYLSYIGYTPRLSNILRSLLSRFAFLTRQQFVPQPEFPLPFEHNIEHNRSLSLIQLIIFQTIREGAYSLLLCLCQMVRCGISSATTTT